MKADTGLLLGISLEAVDVFQFGVYIPVSAIKSVQGKLTLCIWVGAWVTRKLNHTSLVLTGTHSRHNAHSSGLAKGSGKWR